MTDQSQRTIHIEWKRSGIGFTRRQRASVRGLGLRRLHQIVEREDTPQVRGLVAAVPHLVEIVKGPPKPAPWAAIPEYTVHPKAEAPAPHARPAEQDAEAPAAEVQEAAAATKKSAVKREKAPKAVKATSAKGKSKIPAKKASKAAERPAKAKTSKGKK